MPNMSYCRFHNTLGDLQDCKDALDEYEGNRHDRIRLKEIEEEILEIQTRPTMDFTDEEDERLDELHAEKDQLEDSGISESERQKARELIDLCREIADEFESIDLD